MDPGNGTTFDGDVLWQTTFPCIQQFRVTCSVMLADSTLTLSQHKTH